MRLFDLSPKSALHTLILILFFLILSLTFKINVLNYFRKIKAINNSQK